MSRRGKGSRSAANAPSRPQLIILVLVALALLLILLRLAEFAGRRAPHPWPHHASVAVALPGLAHSRTTTAEGSNS